MSARTYAAVSLVVSTVAISLGACGGTVVFEEGADGGGGDGGSSTTDVAVTTVATSQQAGPASTGSTTPSGPGGGVDDVTSVGPGQGPGSGPGQGGANPTGAGGEGPGPSGVGGADVGPVGSVSVTSGGGCSGRLEETEQCCYTLESCQFYELEVECRVDSGSPYTCWCYENGRYLGQCAESESLCDAYNGCCGAYWKLPG